MPRKNKIAICSPCALESGSFNLQTPRFGSSQVDDRKCCLRCLEKPDSSIDLIDSSATVQGHKTSDRPLLHKLDCPSKVLVEQKIEAADIRQGLSGLNNTCDSL